MRVWKKFTAVLLSALLAGAMAVPVFAAEDRIKIEKVSLTFTAYDDGEDTEYGEVEVDTNSRLYDVDDIEFLSTTSTSSYPRVKVTLTTDDDHYFGGSSKSFFTLSGEGATYSSCSLRDQKQTLVVTVQLKDYSGAEADVPDDVDWDYEGSGNWGEVTNAGYYEIRLKKSGTVISDILKIDDTTFNFCNMITQTGNYTFQVRSVNRYVTSNKSKWVSSERWTVDSDTLQDIRRNAANGVYNNYYNGSSTTSSATSTGTTGPSGASTGWQLNSVGYWYRNYDGTWPAACWQQINGYWYYFNQDGYMVANQWLFHTDGNWYYLGGDGKMLTNTRTPDNYYVDQYGIYRAGM